MAYLQSLKNAATVFTRLLRYNLKIIFAGKFIYFLITAVGIFLAVTILTLLNADAQPTEADAFRLLLVPGILLIFYPITFGIQNDVETRMIEILFGIPNYRYKVWLFRLSVIFLATLGFLILFSLLSAVLLTTLPLFRMVYHLMVPLVFLGSLAFMMSTIVRNGSGTAVVMIIIGLIIWIARSFFQQFPQYDVFLNPFTLPDNINESVWPEIILDNRIFLIVGSVFTTLYGLLNLQKREKFL